jgi:hypothetical protein
MERMRLCVVACLVWLLVLCAGARSVVADTTLYFYDTYGPVQHPAVFLAGPTTDTLPDGRTSVAGIEITKWRVDVITRAQACGFKGTFVVPEFSTKGVGNDWFREKAKIIFANWPHDEIASPPLRWENMWLARVDAVVLWLAVTNDGPARGKNARPEAAELIFRYKDKPSWTWGPRYLILGIPPEAESVGRFKVLAKEGAIPVLVNLDQVADAICALK